MIDNYYSLEDLPGEEWKPVLKWKDTEIQPGYYVSNLGRVKNAGRVVTQRGNGGKLYQHSYPARILKPGRDSDGYLVVVLCCPGNKHVDGRIHRLVASFFLDKPDHLDQDQVNHIDGNKENNSSTNLEWCTVAENNEHARETGLNIPGKSQAIRCKFLEWDTVFFSKSEASLATGHSSNYVFDCEAKGTQMKDAVTGQLLHLVYI